MAPPLAATTPFVGFILAIVAFVRFAAEVPTYTASIVASEVSSVSHVDYYCRVSRP